MSGNAVTLPSASRPTLQLTRAASGTGAGSRTVRDGLERVVTRAAVVFRCAWCTVTPLLAFTTGAAAATIVPRAIAVAAVLGWGAVFWRSCRRRTLPVWLVIGDALLYAGLLLAMPVALAGSLAGTPTCGSPVRRRCRSCSPHGG